MKFKIVRKKYGTIISFVQVESYGVYRPLPFVVLLLIFFMGGIARAQDPTTSPLAILKQAPKVRIEETPAYSPPPAVPYVPPRGPAPPIATVYPALTPYAGNTVSGSRPDYLNYGGPVTPPPGMNEPRSARQTPAGPTPRPILGPEDVDRNNGKKRGFVRGLINAIPFVGDDDEELAPTPTPIVGRTYERLPDAPPVQEAPIYRGYEPATNTPAPGAPLLRAPGSDALDAGEPQEALSPPIMTPTPRGSSFAPGAIAPDANPDLDAGRPVLTVKRESDTTSTDAAPVEGSGGTTDKKPSISPSTDEEPVKETQQTSSVLIEEASPNASASVVIPGPAPTPAAEPVAVVEDVVTSLTVEQADLGMPNPTYEQNTTILAEFQTAVRKARTEDYPAAAQMFREYAANHPSSGLAPRALYLSIVFEKDNAKVKESYASLEKLFPKSHYLGTAATRRPEVKGADAVATVAPVEVAVETPQQKVDRLEKELTAAVGDQTREPGLRKDLGAGYIEIEEFDRAWEVLNPALEMAEGKPEEGQILLLMARCQMARRDTTRALAIVEAVDTKFPGTIMTDAASAWNAGLAFESGARYAKARTIYNEIKLKWPASPEAGWAQARLQDLAALAQ